MSEGNLYNDKEVKSQIQIADEVIAIIAGTAALEVEGVGSAVGDTTSSFVEFFGKKNQSKGVRVFVDGADTTVELGLAVKNGFKIQEVAANVQKKVKTAIETMTGLTVSRVNVDICGIILEQTRPKYREQEEAIGN